MSLFREPGRGGRRRREISPERLASALKMENTQRIDADLAELKAAMKGSWKAPLRHLRGLECHVDSFFRYFKKLIIHRDSITIREDVSIQEPHMLDCIYKFAVVVLLLGSVQGATISINPGEIIQAAIDAAGPGDTILVQSGTYYENVNVTKRLTLKGIGMPTVDARGRGDAITLFADGVILEGFETTNSSYSLEAGIKIISKDNIVRNNNASYNKGTGIFVWIASSNNSIINNIVSYNNKSGIFLWNSSNNVISGNTASCNKWNGIRLMDFCSNNAIIRNKAHHNEMHGVSLESSGNNKITENDASYNDLDGVVLEDSPQNTIEGNDAHHNEKNGIRLLNSSHSNVTNNNAGANRWGVFFYKSGNNTVEDNVARANHCGIYLSKTQNSTMRRNLMSDNRYNFRADEVNDIDISNLVDGKPIYYLVGVSDRNGSYSIVMACRSAMKNRQS